MAVVKLTSSAIFPLILVSFLVAITAIAQDNPTAAEKESVGLLPIPDYSGDFWTRHYITGDWGGARTDLANKGIQFGVEWSQTVQGVTDGGIDRTTVYGGSADYTINLDLMRMGVLPGALVRFRAESRYGRSVNGFSGTILPVNTDALFPLSSKLDEDIPFTITDLNYAQFVSENLGFVVGKMDTLDGDPNEFASGRGTHQFMNANLIFNPALALRLPYSTLAAGMVWMPVPVGTNGGITVSSLIMNTADSSTTTGFDDFGKGATWTTEADFQYVLGHLPGGMNIGALYSFDQEFANLNTRLIFQPGEGLVVPKENSTWAAYWSAWQYVFTRDDERRPVNVLDGNPDRQGLGLFARFGFADKDTNPVKWAASGGVGGRGMIPTRDNDTCGIGYYYTQLETSQFVTGATLDDSARGFECYYDIAVTPAVHVTLDLQIVNPATSGVHTATILGLRGTIVF